MKLRLPHLLLTALVATMTSAPVGAAIRHTDATLQTYVDFATNSGRYVADDKANAMLNYIRERDKGVLIGYTTVSAAQKLPNGMLSFDSVVDLGNATAVGHNYIVTVAHNGVLDPTFNGGTSGIGADNTIKYKGIEESSTNGSFVHSITGSDKARDYKITRLSKIVTDAAPATIYKAPIVYGTTDMEGALVYRVGGGDQLLRTPSGDEQFCAAGTYLVGGVGSITTWYDKTNYESGEDVKQGILVASSWESGKGTGEGTPLPFGSTSGDSGSPYFVYDKDTQSFQLLLAHTGSENGNTMYATSAPYWTQATMEADHVHVDMASVKGALKIDGAIKSDDKGGVKDVINGAEVTINSAMGFLRHDDGNLYDKNNDSVAFRGIATGQHTWKDLSDLKNNDNWYAYSNNYLNATESVVVVDKVNIPATGITYAELYRTQNLVFDAAADNAAYAINVTADTDLGIGYLHFAADKVGNVVFNVSSEENKLLNSAGYVVDEGVQVNVSLRNADDKYMREWRKVGEGTLNICGKGGNNEIFLNVGGKGETLLNQEDGYYAAYNVLVNSGSTVKIKDTKQIYRDLTFGNGGGTLDMNGNIMAWYLSEGEDRKDAFTIHALTEEAIISNSAAQKAVLTFKEGSEQKFVGSFQDSATSALGIVYDGKGTWELNSIRTQLKHADSGLTVESGTVRLSGTNTVHGEGSATGRNATRYTNAEDWHYADATMNVTVADGATFELASHARLTGDVTVQSKGKYIMREGVNHAEEYIEGGEKKESTGGEVAKYYGHWGDVKLAEDSEMLVAYTAGTDTATRYTGKVSGPGKLTVDLGTDAAAFVLDGEVSGVKSVDVVGKSKLELGSNVTIAELQSGNASFTKVHTMNEDVLSGSEEEQLSMKNTYMVVTAGKTYTISHAKVEGSYIDAKEGSTLKLSDVYVAAGTYLTDAPATLVADDTTLQVVVGTNATAQALTLSGALTVEAPGGADKATVAATDKVLQITSSIMDTFTVTGSLLTIDLTGSEWSFDGTALTLNGVAVGDWIALSFDTDDKSAASFDKNLAVKLTFSGVEALADVSLTGYYDVAEAAPTTVYFQTRYVPEPSTATLSLLALAALCARRRRRMA